MLTNYIYIFAPVLLLALISLLKDRYKPTNPTLAEHPWSLMPGIIALVLFTSGHIALSYWNYFPFLKNYKFNGVNWNIASLVTLSCILLFLCLLVRFRYVRSIREVFNLRIMYLPFILKVCGILTLVIIANYYFIDFDDTLVSLSARVAYLKTLNLGSIMLYFAASLILAPIVEEIIYRGLLYSALYRKIGRWGAIALSSLLWTHGHYASIRESFMLFILGVVLAWLYDRRGSLLHPIVFHMFRNSWIILYLMVKS